MIKRKYMAEFGLTVFTSYRNLIPISELDNIEDDNDYHLYSIMASNKLIIDKSSIILSEEGVSCIILKIQENIENKIFINNLLLHEDIDHSKIEFDLKYPYETITFKGLSKSNTPFDITVDTHYLAYFYASGLSWDLEVLYIGQSYGENGERKAQDRLKSHSTFQKILSDCHSKYQDKKLYLFLMEMTPLLTTTFDGISKNYEKSDEEDKKHIEQIFANPPKYKQIINISEAALINYFKPKYNVNFIENFPDKAHIGYRQYYDLDYNHLTVEIDMDFSIPNNVIFSSKTNNLDRRNRFVKYSLHNEKFRKNMYDIFKLTNS